MTEDMLKANIEKVVSLTEERNGVERKLGMVSSMRAVIDEPNEFSAYICYGNYQLSVSKEELLSALDTKEQKLRERLDSLTKELSDMFKDRESEADLPNSNFVYLDREGNSNESD